MGESRTRVGWGTLGDMLHAALSELGKGRGLQVNGHSAILDLGAGTYRWLVLMGAGTHNAAACSEHVRRLRLDAGLCDQVVAEDMPATEGSNGSVVSPGLCAVEARALAETLGRTGRPLWVEFVTGQVRTGLLCSAGDGEVLVQEVRGDRGLGTLSVYMYRAAFRPEAGGYGRRVDDATGAYALLAGIEAGNSGMAGAPAEEVMCMMTREAELAALACAGLAFPTTAVSPCPMPAWGVSRALVRMGRDEGLDDFRRELGLPPWPAARARHMLH